jgi:hypothetical protein
VKVAGVHATTTSGRSKKFRLELEAEEAPQDQFLEVSNAKKMSASRSWLWRWAIENEPIFVGKMRDAFGPVSHWYRIFWVVNREGQNGLGQIGSF